MFCGCIVLNKSNYYNGENFRHDDRLEKREVFLCFAYGLIQMAAKHAL